SNITAVSLVVSISALAADTDRATCTAVKCSGCVPNAFDTRTRSCVPPTERCTTCRNVASRISSESNKFAVSGTCCEAAQDPTQCGLVCAPKDPTATRPAIAQINTFNCPKCIQPPKPEYSPISDPDGAPASLLQISSNPQPASSANPPQPTPSP